MFLARGPRIALFLLGGLALGSPAMVFPGCGAQAPVVTSSNASIRVMAANLTGNGQTYEADAIRIFQGLKPDIVAIQEFKYLGSTANDIRTMVKLPRLGPISPITVRQDIPFRTVLSADGRLSPRAHGRMSIPA